MSLFTVQIAQKHRETARDALKMVKKKKAYGSKGSIALRKSFGPRSKSSLYKKNSPLSSFVSLSNGNKQFGLATLAPIKMGTMVQEYDYSNIRQDDRSNKVSPMNMMGWFKEDLYIA